MRNRRCGATCKDSLLLIVGLALLTFITITFTLPRLANGEEAGSTSKSAAERGLEIASEMDLRDKGFGDYTSTMEMILKNRHGVETTRKIRGKGLEVEGDGDKTLSIFDTPKDIKGTTFLNHTHKVGDDDRWLRLGMSSRPKHISSSNKSGSFLGSEFAYEDIASQEVEKYTYKYVGDSVLDGIKVFILERYPVDKNSGYTRQVLYVDSNRYISLKTIFYDRKNSLLKTLLFKEYKQYLGKFWRADEMFMENHQTGKSTRLLWHDYKFKTGLTDRDFHQSVLKSIR